MGIKIISKHLPKDPWEKVVSKLKINWNALVLKWPWLSWVRLKNEKIIEKKWNYIIITGVDNNWKKYKCFVNKLKSWKNLIW